MKKITMIATIAMAGIMMVAAPFAACAAENATETELTGNEAARDGLTFDDAVEIALKDAGQSVDNVTFSKKMLEFEDGIKVYEIEFMIPGEEKFEYVINHKTGAIMDKDEDDWEPEDDAEYAALLAEPQAYFDFNAAENQIVTMPAYSTLIDECAKDRQEELCYFKDGMEYDDGMVVYKLGAMIPKEIKFEYTFDMKTGNVIKTEKEGWEAEDNAEYRELLTDHGFEA